MISPECGSVCRARATFDTVTRLKAAPYPYFVANAVLSAQLRRDDGRIAQENSALQTLETRLTDAQGAAVRRKDLQTERDDTYGRVFDAIIDFRPAVISFHLGDPDGLVERAHSVGALWMQQVMNVEQARRAVEKA